MDDGNLAILVDAKTEYTKQLVNIISPNIYLGIKKIYNESKELCSNNNDEDVLCQFQNDLSEIPKWNQEVINGECDILIKNSKCDWLEDLLTAVFVSHTRILTSINVNKNKNKINLKIPKVDHFIHLCFIEIARHFWKNPYLFDDSISKFEYQRNRRDAEKIIDNTINETIRKQLPVKHILKEYLGNEFKDTKLEDETITESNDNENLRKMVKAEIENCSKEKLKKLNINPDENMDVMEDDSLLDLNEDPKVELDNPAKVELDSPAKVELDSPAKVELDSPAKVELDSPAKVELDSPAKVELDSPAKVELDSPAKVELDNPAKVELDNPAKVELDNPAKVELDSPTKVELDSPAKVELDSPAKVELDSPAKVELDSLATEKSLKIQSLDKDINDLIDNEVNNLKIETLNLDFDDLQNLEEIYIDEPKIDKIDINDTQNKIKTVYIETDENKEDKVKKHSKNDFNFF